MGSTPSSRRWSNDPVSDVRNDFISGSSTSGMMVVVVVATVVDTEHECKQDDVSTPKTTNIQSQPPSLETLDRDIGGVVDRKKKRGGISVTSSLAMSMALIRVEIRYVVSPVVSVGTQPSTTLKSQPIHKSTECRPRIN